MRSRSFCVSLLVLSIVFAFTTAAFAFEPAIDTALATAKGLFFVKSYKMAFTHYDFAAKRAETVVTKLDKDDHCICINSAIKNQQKEGAEVLNHSFHAYYMAGLCLEKMGKPADAVNYYVKALYMTRVRKPVTFIQGVFFKKNRNVVIDIQPKELNLVYDRIYALGIDTVVLAEKIRAVGEIRRDLANLIAGNIDPEKQDEYKARFEVCQKSEKNLCVLLENFVVYEMNRGVYTRFDALVKYLNDFKPLTHAIDGVLGVGEVAKQNLIKIIANSTNPASTPTLPELQTKLDGLTEILTYIHANIQ